MKVFLHSSYALGLYAENLSAHYLQACGYTIRASRFRTKQGEVDLVVQQADCLVFVEVKARASPSCGSGMEAVDSFKWMKLSSVIDAYIQGVSWSGNIRMDGIELEFSPQHQLTHMQHLKNLFL